MYALLFALPSNDNDPESCPAIRAIVVERLADLQRRRIRGAAQIRLAERDGATVGWTSYLYLRQKVLCGAILKFERMLQGSWIEAFQARRDLL